MTDDELKAIEARLNTVTMCDCDDRCSGEHYAGSGKLLSNDADDLLAEVRRIRKENNRYRDTLSFYADNGGIRARAALRYGN